MIIIKTCGKGEKKRNYNLEFDRTLILALTLLRLQHPRKSLHSPLTRKDQATEFPALRSPNRYVARDIGECARREQCADFSEIWLVDAVLEHGDEGRRVAAGGEEVRVAVFGSGFCFEEENWYWWWHCVLCVG